MKKLEKRIKEVENKIGSKKKDGIHSYEDFIIARERGEKIDYDSTPYLRRRKKSIERLISKMHE